MTSAYVVTRVVLRACILCGEQEWNAAGDAQRELTEVEAVAERNARCARCGGSLVVEVDTRRVRLKPEIDWYTDRPRRGRPPKAISTEGKTWQQKRFRVKLSSMTTDGQACPDGA